ncbi:MAG: acyltransferase [Propionibacteriaceae bacterium]|nr:acyltransferase [Propionibacteriaceae bacterium]
MEKPETSTDKAEAVRVDIQWMRALAVGLVILFHFWPTWVQGGFVGVDIFFVISGFLITSHLLKKPPTHARDLVVFWGRRIRRLLPAAFTVIILTMIAVLVFGPNTQWQGNGWSGVYSALYVENWNLAWTSVDYLGAADPPTALQHYWSLSVEEQFYLLWPILILAIALIVRKNWAFFRVAAGVGISLVVVASLAWSVYFTSVNPPQAYFVTPTRMWELGAGAALAAAYPVIASRLAPHPFVKLIAVTVGVVMMAWSGFFLTGEAFPGWIAVIPIMGALVVIGAGPGEHRWSFDTILRLRPFQLLGDISYSVYLWHWPFVIIVPWVLGHEMTFVIKVVVIAVVLVLSWLSKTLIEDRFRGMRPLGQPLRRTFIFLVVGMAITIGVSVVPLFMVQEAGKSNDPVVIPTAVSCIGAAARLDPACRAGDPHGTELLMTPLQAAEDINVNYADGCSWGPGEPQLFPACIYGSSDADAPQIALFGNSHAAPYLDALIELADEQEWGLRTYLASGCAPSLLPLAFSLAGAQQGCLDFTTQAIQGMKDHGTQLVVMSAYTRDYPLVDIPAENQVDAFAAMYTDLLPMLVGAGMHVLVIRDVPYPSHTVVDCLAEHLDNIGVCDGPRSSWLLPDPLFEAAQQSHDLRITTLDFTDAMCDQETCWVVVGGIIVYFNQGHLTSTFVHTLRPYLDPAILAVVD